MLSPVSGAGPSTLKPATGATEISTDDFFRLVSAQLQGQNPLEPVDETQFMGQLAQYAQLDESESTNQLLSQMVLMQENLAALSQLTQGSDLLGQKVEYTDPETGEPAAGTVQAIRAEQGLIVADVDGKSVPLTLLTAVLGRDDGDDA